MLIKPAYNAEFRTYDFSPQLTTGETLASATVQILRDDTGADDSATMVSDVAVYNDTEVRYKLFGGVSGKTYRRVFRVTTSNNQQLEESAALQVK